MRLPGARIRVLAASALTVAAIQASAATPASAVSSCSTVHAHAGGDWQPQAGVDFGLRGPVQARRDGTTCTNGGASVWLGIQSGSETVPGPELAQIGYIRYWDASANPPTTKFCLFEEVVPQEPKYNAYDCSTNANDIYEWVEVVEVGIFYDIYDCGVSDPTFASCKEKDAVSTSFFPNSFGLQMGESNNATSPSCPVQIMGSKADPDNTGSTTYPVQGKISSTDTWQPRVTDKHNDGPVACNTYYVPTVVAHGVVTIYDSRNTS